MYCEIKNALIYYQIPTKLLDFGVNESAPPPPGKPRIDIGPTPTPGEAACYTSRKITWQFYYSIYGFTNLQAEQKYEFFCLGNELCFVDRNHSWMIKNFFLNILSCQDHNKGFTYYKN